MKTRYQVLIALAIVSVGAAVGPIISRLRDLSDVRIATSPTTGQALVWNGTVWTNNSAGGTSTNTYNTLIVTQYVRLPWVTLAMTGTNVAQIDLAAGSMFRVYLGANAFFGAVTNHPGTNISQTIQIALIQDGSGTKGVTMTNSTWFLNGSGSSTNAQPTINTNANALTLLTFVTSPTNATHMLGVPTSIAP